MDLLEEMERQQKDLSAENSVLRTENDSYQNEISRLSAILAAREQVRERLAVSPLLQACHVHTRLPRTIIHSLVTAPKHAHVSHASSIFCDGQ